MTREEAVWTLQKAVDEAFGAGIEIITRDGCEAIEMAIEALQERKTGKWLFDISGCDAIEAMFKLPKCSICGAETPHPKARYCPNCGAKMEVEE